MHRESLSHPDLDDILGGIEAELQDTPEFFEFYIEERVQDGQLWILSIDLTQTLRSEGLDESLEGAVVWWAGPPKGGADVLAVIPESQQITLRFATTPPPPKGGRIRIYPPHYLEALLHCWENKARARQCLAWLAALYQANTLDKDKVLGTQLFPWLRPRQAEAFTLPGWKVGFLWGPPGTGKTTTLGAVLAQYLVRFPNARVLLLSTTNSAVDLALIAVDKALEGLAHQSVAAAQARQNCFRVGNHFIASHYRGREHLLSVKDERLIRQLADLEAKRPDKEDVQAYAQWQQQVELVRLQIRMQASRVLKHARLAAMTTTRAIFTFEDLHELSPYDLIVFDEASQVGLAHALAIAPLAHSVLLARDPKQLSPIVRSTHRLARRWLGDSMFFYMDESSDSTCLLNEQFRMAEPICDIVSNLFYKGKLVVASDCKHSPQWEAERTLPSTPPMGRKHVYLQTIEENGTWSQKYHGPIRYRSAVFVQELVIKLIEHTNPNDILVLTPFRAQRALIRSLLRSAGCNRVTVSTVHRAQGSERHTVIFDPVQGDSQFLQEENAPRLINVALSRAKARLVIALSPGDRKNPLLDRIANIIDNSDAFHDRIPLSQLVSQPSFPDCALGMVVQIEDITGRLVEIDKHADKLVVADIRTGHKRKYVISGLIEQFSDSRLQLRPNKVQNGGKPNEDLDSSGTIAKGRANQHTNAPTPGMRTSSADLSQEFAHLRDKARKILTDPKVHWWTPAERKDIREKLGSKGLGDEELARKILAMIAHANQ